MPMAVHALTATYADQGALYGPSFKFLIINNSITER